MRASSRTCPDNHRAHSVRFSATRSALRLSTEGSYTCPLCESKPHGFQQDRLQADTVKCSRCSREHSPMERDGGDPESETCCGVNGGRKQSRWSCKSLQEDQIPRASDTSQDAQCEPAKSYDTRVATHCPSHMAEGNMLGTEARYTPDLSDAKCPMSPVAWYLSRDGDSCGPFWV